MQQENDKQVNQSQSDLSIFSTVAIALFAVVFSSTVFFHLVEKWNWLDSLYFTIVTISTVGYGNLVPETNAGKIGNIFVIILGIGIFTVFVTQFVKRQGLRRLERKSHHKDKDD